MSLKGMFYRSDYVKSNSIFEHINSFGFDKMYNFLSGSRVKPYDDRELDMFEGIKFISFFLASVAQVCTCLVISWIYNLFYVFTIFRWLITDVMAMTNLALENFFFISAFFTTYKCI